MDVKEKESKNALRIGGEFNSFTKNGHWSETNL
jgi:hypothetical protein